MASTPNLATPDVLPHGPAQRPHQLSWPVTALVVVAAAKSIVGILLVTPLAPAVIDESQLGPQAAFGNLPWLIPGILLLLANSRECRTGLLGVAMLMVAGRTYIETFQLLAPVAPPVMLLAYASPYAFAPYFFGRFLLEFPQPRSGPAARWLTVATQMAGVIGSVQFTALLLRPFMAGRYQPFIYQLIVGGIDTRIGLLVTYGFSVIVMGVSFVGLDGLLPEDRRRQKRLVLGCVLIFLPMLAAFMQVALAERNSSARVNPYMAIHRLIGLLAFLYIVAPSLLAYRALERRPRLAREMARRAMQFVLHRQLLIGWTLAPVIWLAIVAYAHRDQSVSVVFSGTAIAWMLVAVTNAMLLFWRRRLLRLGHRWLFREGYDPSETLFDLTNRMRHARGIDEMVAHLTAGIDRVLRPYRVVVLVRDESSTQFVPLFGSCEPLSSASLLADLLTAGRGALDTPLAGGTSPMRWLPQEERYWLVDCGARLIIPLHGSDGSLNGLITIGDRKSGRPYTDDDRQWLTAVAESASLTIEAHSGSAASTGEAHAVRDPWRVGLVQRHARALECDQCGHIDEASATGGAQCGATLTLSLVPRVLFGKFRFDQRIGRGGMGIVFRATDLALDREVAVKMLPGATPEYSELLRLEARAMAAVTHRHLAVVYGVEAWHGQPLLVCEYMEHGTLADRLAHGPVSADNVLALGVALGEALELIHARRLLHRDIKPSNIGFDRTDVPKLLDFGLAQPVSATQLPKDLRPEIRMAGTPLYMSPESVAGLPPTHAVDLWSLHVLLFEAMSGRHPFRRDSTESTLDAIAAAPAPPLTVTGGLSPDRKIRIASYFSNALSKNIAERPRSAADVIASLRSLMT